MGAYNQKLIVDGPACRRCNDTESVLKDSSRPELGSTECRCSLRKKIEPRVPSGTLDTKVESRHIDAYGKTGHQVEGVAETPMHFTGSAGDVYALMHCHVAWLLKLGCFEPITLVSDLGVVRMAKRAADFRNEDAADLTTYGQDTRGLMIVQLNHISGASKDAADALYELLEARTRARRRVWVFEDAGAPFTASCPAHSRIVASLMSGFRHVVVAPDSAAQSLARLAPAADSALRATAPGRCADCGGTITRGDGFKWFDANKRRSHLSCKTAAEKSAS